MRKVILFIGLCLIWLPWVYGNRSVENPVFKARTGSILTIRKIEWTDEATRLHVQVVFPPDHWITIDSTTYIEDCATAQRYLPVAIEGMAFNEKTYLPASGKMDVVLVYPPLPASTRTIDWIDPADSEARTYGISLGAPEKIKNNLPEPIRGNWITQDGRNEWVAGLYDSLAVYRDRFWNYASVRKKGKRYLVDLENETGTCRLTFQPEKNGYCRITEEGHTFYCGQKPNDSVKPEPDTEDFSNFFRSDTAYIQGYLKGYDPVLSFTSGMIYAANELTRESFPTVVAIRPDGRFEVKLPLNYPGWHSILVRNCWIPFYIEPGQRLTLFVDHEALLDYQRSRQRGGLIRDILYMGEPAAICRTREQTHSLFPFSYAELRNDQQLLTPAQYKEKRSADLARWIAEADSAIAAGRLPAKAARMLRNSARMEYGATMFGFVDMRFLLARMDTSNQVLKVKEDDNYYDFLRQMPLDDETLPACDNFSDFINHLEYTKLLSRFMLWHSPEELLQLALENDSLKIEKLTRFLGVSSIPFAWQTAIVRNMNSAMDWMKDKELARRYLEKTKKWLTFPVLSASADYLYDRLYSEISGSYELPDGPGTEILRKITDRYKGKYVMIDFWATTCGPCRGEIERTAHLREKYRDSNDIRIIFITSEEESNEKDYADYVAKNLAGSDSYRLPADDYRYLRELFHINGIPHSETLNRQGRVLRRGLAYETFESRFQELLENEKR